MLPMFRRRMRYWPTLGVQPLHRRGAARTGADDRWCGCDSGSVVWTADRSLHGTPDVIVVPQLHDAGEPSAAPIVEWLQHQDSQGDPLLVSVCLGAEVLDSAGLLDGRPATSHWLGLIGLRRSYPAVQWTDVVRYVDDGDVITAAGVLSGVDAALRVVERTVGRGTAEQAAAAVAWPDYSPGGAAPIPRLRPAPAGTLRVPGMSRPPVGWPRHCSIQT
jgi:transcriptional regulator GlxA family with amidase domain